MKKGLLGALLTFSLALNLAVAGTLGWYLLKTRAARPGQPPAVALSQDEARVIANLWPSKRRANMIHMRQELFKKKTEILEMIARNPGDVKAMEPQIAELTALRGRMERQALARISAIMAQLPPEKRQDFLAFLKTRVGLAMRRHMRRGMGCLGPRGGEHLGTGRDLGNDSAGRSGPDR
jgi:hypothetical protein